MGKDLEIWVLCSGAAIYIAVFLLCAAGIASGQAPRAVGRSASVLPRTPSEPGADLDELHRRSVVLRNVSPLSQHFSLGISSRCARIHHCREPPRQLASSHEGRNRISVVPSVSSLGHWSRLQYPENSTLLCLSGNMTGSGASRRFAFETFANRASIQCRGALWRCLALASVSDAFRFRFAFCCAASRLDLRCIGTALVA